MRTVSKKKTIASLLSIEPGGEFGDVVVVTNKKNFVVDFKKRRGRRYDDLIVAADSHDVDGETRADFQFEQMFADDPFRRLHGDEAEVWIEFHVFHDIA